jgi:hypothetical protein
VAAAGPGGGQPRGRALADEVAFGLGQFRCDSMGVEDGTKGPVPCQQTTGEPLCGSPFSQVALDRRGQS